MSIECYFHWCKGHSQVEPLCDLPKCIATEEEIKKFEKKRRCEING